MTTARAAVLGRLLAVPVFLSAVTLGVWLAGDSPAARIANAELLWKACGPLCVTFTVLGLLKYGSERALVLPTPLVMWMVLAAQRTSGPKLLAQLLAQTAVAALLFACWQAKRGLALCAALAASIAAVWMLLGGSGGTFP